MNGETPTPPANDPNDSYTDDIDHQELLSMYREAYIFVLREGEPVTFGQLQNNLGEKYDDLIENADEPDTEDPDPNSNAGKLVLYARDFGKWDLVMEMLVADENANNDILGSFSYSLRRKEKYNSTVEFDDLFIYRSGSRLLKYNDVEVRPEDISDLEDAIEYLGLFTLDKTSHVTFSDGIEAFGLESSATTKSYLKVFLQSIQEIQIGDGWQKLSWEEFVGKVRNQL